MEARLCFQGKYSTSNHSNVVTYEHLPIFECFAFSLFAALSALTHFTKKWKAGGKVEASYLGCKCRCMLLATDFVVKSRVHYGKNVQDSVSLQLIPPGALFKPGLEPLRKTKEGTSGVQQPSFVTMLSAWPDPKCILVLEHSRPAYKACNSASSHTFGQRSLRHSRSAVNHSIQRVRHDRAWRAGQS